jgi:hypothetical protein
LAPHGKTVDPDPALPAATLCPLHLP